MKREALGLLRIVPSPPPAANRAKRVACRRRAATADAGSRRRRTWIGALFAIERSMTGAPAKERREIRQARAAPIVDAFFAWCDQEAGRVLDLSPIASGIGYARNQRVALRRRRPDCPCTTTFRN
jgi:hypothetical protein